MIGPENLLHFLNQSDAKLKPITTWSLVFSRASLEQFVLNLSSYRLLEISSFHFISDYFGFAFTTLNRKQLYGQASLALTPGLYTVHCLVMVIIREVISIG